MIKSHLRRVFFCDICGKEHESLKEAEESCGKFKTEEPRFALGDMVKGWELFACLCRRGGYIPEGPIVRIIGPVVGSLTTKGGKRDTWNFGHVYLYELDYSCPHCGKKKESKQFFANELKLIAKGSGNILSLIASGSKR